MPEIELYDVLSQEKYLPTCYTKNDGHYGSQQKKTCRGEI